MNIWIGFILGMIMILSGLFGHQYIKDNYSNENIECYDRFGKEIIDLKCKGINEDLILIDSILQMLSFVGIILLIGNTSIEFFKQSEDKD